MLYFDVEADARIRMLFQSLFENFLARRNLTVQRFDPVICSMGHVVNRAVVREEIAANAAHVFCPRCAEQIALPKTDEPIQVTKRVAADVETQRHVADQRSRFENVLFRLKAYVTKQKIALPDCFISYAWGDAEQERWVEKFLATDLLKAGIRVVLDRWHATVGMSLPRYVERVLKVDRVIVVGTPRYQKKYDNNEPMGAFVVAAEGDLIGERLLGSEAQKQTVLPILLEGTKESAFPRLLHPKIFADFRRSETYFETALGLILGLYQIQPQDPVAIELRESLRGSR